MKNLFVCKESIFLQKLMSLMFREDICDACTDKSNPKYISELPNNVFLEQEN